MIEADVDFVPAQPGWDVLYYDGDGKYSSAPVVAWAVMRDALGFLRAVAITADMAWSIDEDRTVCGPDGRVDCGDEGWLSSMAWLAAMVLRGAEPSLRSDEPSPAPPIMLDHYRNRFQTP